MDNNTEKIEKKLRKYTRIHKVFEKDDLILAKDPFTKHLVKDIVGDLPITFTTDPNKATKIVLPWTGDDENNTFLHAIFNNKKLEADPKIVKLFLPLTDKEVTQLAKSHKLSFEPMAKDKAIEKITDTMAKAFPDTPNTLRKSVEKLENITNQR